MNKVFFPYVHRIVSSVQVRESPAASSALPKALITAGRSEHSSQQRGWRWGSCSPRGCASDKWPKNRALPIEGRRQTGGPSRRAAVSPAPGKGTFLRSRLVRRPSAPRLQSSPTAFSPVPSLRRGVAQHMGTDVPGVPQAGTKVPFLPPGMEPQRGRGHGARDAALPSGRRREQRGDESGAA